MYFLVCKVHFVIFGGGGGLSTVLFTIGTYWNNTINRYIYIYIIYIYIHLFIFVQTLEHGSCKWQCFAKRDYHLCLMHISCVFQGLWVVHGHAIIVHTKKAATSSACATQRQNPQLSRYKDAHVSVICRTEVLLHQILTICLSLFTERCHVKSHREVQTEVLYQEEDWLDW